MHLETFNATSVKFILASQETIKYTRYMSLEGDILSLLNTPRSDILDYFLGTASAACHTSPTSILFFVLPLNTF